MSPEEEQEILRRLRDATGFAFGPERLPDVRVAVARALERHALPDVPALLRALESHAAPIGPLVDDVMVGETYFFREPEHFELLRSVVLPDVTAAPRIWSAGCSTGEEPWSIAMLLGEEGRLGGARVLGTDISAAAIARARGGVYGRWSLRGPWAWRAQAALTPTGDGRFAVPPALRASVRLDRLNLVADPYPSGMHVIFCRNVLIYLQRPLVEAVALRLHHALAPGGWLILASTDPPVQSLAPFDVISTPHGVFCRRSDGTPAPAPVAVAPPAPPQRRRPPSRPPRPVSAAPLPAPPTAPEDPALAIRAMANRGDHAGAARAVTDALRRTPDSVALQHLHAAVLLELGDPAGAAAALRRALYLDPKLIMAHLLLGTTLRRLGDAAGARRALRAAGKLCGDLDPAAVVPLAEGASAAYLSALAAREESRIG